MVPAAARNDPEPAAEPRAKTRSTRRVRTRGLLSRLERLKLPRLRLGKKGRRRLLVAKVVLAVTAPIWLLNSAVAFFGHTVVFPLSPFFLREKLRALVTYAAHRPFCLGREHPEIGPLIESAEVRHHLPRGLLAAVIEVESGGQPHRISSAGAMGPTQLMPDTARRLGVSDPFDTTTAVDGAARLLSQHLVRFHKLRLAIAAYNAGPAAVMGGVVPNNGQTPGYVVRVMRAYQARRPRVLAERTQRADP
jgi:hypothetical protein